MWEEEEERERESKKERGEVSMEVKSLYWRLNNT
jgi:hypothetical protein